MAGKPKHGLSFTPEYRAWQTMRLRCTNPKNEAYPDYGGRGITVCDRWLNSVENFMADMGQKPGKNYELDRKDNNKGYEPDNCHWVTRSRNDRNRRSTKFIIFHGQTVCLDDICDQYEISRDTVGKRLNGGWDVERAITTPARSKAPNGTKAEIDKLGVPYETVKRRIEQGWTFEEAVLIPKRFKKIPPKNKLNRHMKQLLEAKSSMNRHSEKDILQEVSI